MKHQRSTLNSIISFYCHPLSLANNSRSTDEYKRNSVRQYFHPFQKLIIAGYVYTKTIPIAVLIVYSASYIIQIIIITDETMWLLLHTQIYVYIIYIKYKSTLTHHIGVCVCVCRWVLHGSIILYYWQVYSFYSVGRYKPSGVLEMYYILLYYVQYFMYT